MTKNIKNVIASKHAKIVNIAKEQGLATEPLFLLYMEERLLYRISQSPLADKLILKGGLLLFSLFRQTARPTRDIDALAIDLPDDPATLAAMFKPVFGMDVGDGVVFDVESIVAEVIREAANYQGVRLSVNAYLGKVRSKVQLDIGFHDFVSPEPMRMSYPVLLDDPVPILSAYSLESVVSEKFDAMILLGSINSRMKDFYDVAMLAEHHDFDGLLLSTAVSQTLRRRKTICPTDPAVLSLEFADDPSRRRQWQAFERNIGAPASDFSGCMAGIRSFLEPVYRAHLAGESIGGRWERHIKAWR